MTDTHKPATTLSDEDAAHNPMPLPDFDYAALCCEETGKHGLLEAPTYSSTFSAKAMRHVAAALREREALRQRLRVAEERIALYEIAFGKIEVRVGGPCSACGAADHAYCHEECVPASDSASKETPDAE